MFRTCSSVICLLFTSSPPAVRRTIWTVIINSIQAILYSRTRTHVLKKNRKAVYPFFRNYYAPTTVICKSLCFRVKASIFHHGPATVFRAVTKTMFCICKACLFTVQAATRIGLPTKIVAENYCALPTITNTTRLTVRQAFDHDQPSKTFPGPLHVPSIAREKRYFNTKKGKGRAADFMTNYRRHVL